jgi:hypothetical protein
MQIFAFLEKKLGKYSQNGRLFGKSERRSEFEKDSDFVTLILILGN